MSRLEREPARRAGAAGRGGPRGGPRPRLGRPPRGEQDLAGRGRRDPLAAGQRDFGENRVQELVARPALAERPVAISAGVRWHFIGQLQRNKAAAVARLGAVVHSVDRPQLVTVPGPGGRELPAPVPVFVQVDLGGAAGELGRAGARARRRRRSWRTRSRRRRASGCGASWRWRRGGLIRRRPSSAWPRWRPACGRTIPSAGELSAGMSGDLEAAVAAGATVVRVGTALFGVGPYPPVRSRITSHPSHTSHTHPGGSRVDRRRHADGRWARR